MRTNQIVFMMIVAAGCGRTDFQEGTTPDAAAPSSVADAGPDCLTPTPAPGVVGAAYAASYSAYALGAVPGLPNEYYGGMTLKNGDPNTLLVGCHQDSMNDGALCSVPLVRSCGHVVGFAGPATQIATAPYIDGGLQYAPNGVLLYTEWPSNAIGEILPAGNAPAATINLENAEINVGVGSLAIVPSGFAGAGMITVMGFDGNGYESAYLGEDATGLYELSGVTNAGGARGSEGHAYVPHGSPGFTGDTMIVDQNGRVVTYQLDASGNPLPNTEQAFSEGIDTPAGAFFDPTTGDFLFSLRYSHYAGAGSDGVYIVRGFAPVI